MFKKVVGFLFVLSVLGIALASCSKEQSPATNDELCRTVFEALQDNDLESFTSLLVTEDVFQGMLNSLDESIPKEKSIKGDFSAEFDVEKSTGESLKSFNKLEVQGQEKNIDFKNAVYSGVHFRKTRYEAGNHACKKVKFKITEGEKLYSVVVYLFQTDEGMYIYDELKVAVWPDFKFNLISPTENPVTVSAGQDLKLAIEFNADAANERGAWIQTVFDSKGGRMYYDSSMKSPYDTILRSDALTPGKHTVEYFLQPSGSSTDNPLAAVKLDIIVK